jgi:hypothetical protein
MFPPFHPGISVGHQIHGWALLAEAVTALDRTLAGDSTASIPRASRGLASGERVRRSSAIRAAAKPLRAGPEVAGP